MGIGPITPTPQGPVAEPDSSIAVTIGTGFGKMFRDTGPVWMEELTDFDGVIVADGVSPIRHFFKDELLRTGLLAPRPAPTLAYTGTPATCYITGSAPVQGDYLILGTSPGVRITITATLDPTGASGHQVLLSTLANTLQYMNDLILGNAGQGTTYVNADQAQGKNPSDIPTLYGFTVQTVTASTITLVSTFAGVGANYLLAVNGTASWTVNPWTGGADGTGECPEAGVYYWAQGYYRSIDGAISAIGEPAGLTLGGPGQVDISDLIQSEDPQTDWVWVWRTQAYQGLFWKDAEAPKPDTTATDGVCDVDLTGLGAVPYDESLYRPYGAGHVPRYRYVVQHMGMLFGGGAILQSDYSVGSYIAPDAVNYSVTLTDGAIVTEDLEGKTFIPSPDTNTVEFLIVGVDVAANKLDLNMGAQQQILNAPYVIRDQRSPTEIGYTPPLRINNWPPWQTITGVNAQGEEGITGMFSAWESLFIWTQGALWRLSGTEPSNFILRRIFTNCGCVSGHSIVFVRGALHWMGPEGIWRWAGSGEPQLLTKPIIPGQPIGIDQTIRRINWDVAEQIVGSYDGNSKIISWHVSLDDEYISTHAITYDIQTGAFNTERFDDWTAREMVRGVDGRLINLGGDYQGNLWEAEISNSDGVYDIEPLQAAAAGASHLVIPLSGSPSLPSLSGAPALFISADGDFMRGKIESNTVDTIVLSEALPSIPAEGSYVYLGAIDLHMESGDFTNGIIDHTKVMADAIIGHIPTAGGEYFYAAGRNDDEPKIPVHGAKVGSLSNEKGKTHFRPNRRGYRHRHYLRSFAPGTDPEFVQIDYSMRTAAVPRMQQ